MSYLNKIFYKLHIVIIDFIEMLGFREIIYILASMNLDKILEILELALKEFHVENYQLFPNKLETHFNLGASAKIWGKILMILALLMKKVEVEIRV